MDTFNPDQVLSEAYQKAPKAVQEYIDSGAFEALLEKMRRELRLSRETTAAAGFEILMAILGIADPTELPISLDVDAKVPRESLDKLVTLLNDDVFTPLKRKATDAPPAPVTAPRPPAPIAPAPPINRLTPAAQPTPVLSKPVSAPAPQPVATKPTVPPPPTATPATTSPKESLSPSLSTPAKTHDPYREPIE